MTIDRHVAEIREEGFTIVENAIEPALFDSLGGELERLEAALGAKPTTC
jgi:hypothetical protein